MRSGAALAEEAIDSIARQVVEALVERLGDEVELVFEYGSRVTGNTHRFSDLDFSYVPAHDSAHTNITVLVGGTLFDLYPMPWSKLEEMARFENVSSSVLLHHRVLYARDEAAAARFGSLAGRLRALLEPEAKPLAVRTAQRIFGRASQPYFLLRALAAQGHVLGCLQQSGTILAALFHAVAVANQACIDTRKLEQVWALPELPEGFREAAQIAVRSCRPDELLQACEALLLATRRFLAEQGRRHVRCERTYPELCRAMYPEMRAALDKLVVACERGDRLLAKVCVVSVLEELMVRMAQATTGVELSGFHSAADYEQELSALGFPDLLAPLERGDLAELSTRAAAFDRRLRQFLAENDVALCEFADREELRAALRIGQV